MISINPESALAHAFLDGLQGIEIGGSAYNPFNIPGCRNVDFTADLNTVFKIEERRLAGKALPVDVVARGDALPFADGSLDFVLSSHVLEHFFDPIAALKEWKRVLRPGGILFMIVPHKERTFDKDRPRTPLSELVARHEGRLSDAPRDESKHFSVWITNDVVSLVEYLDFSILAVEDVDDKVGNGFTVVCEKRRMPERVIEEARSLPRIPGVFAPFCVDALSADAADPILAGGRRHMGIDLPVAGTLRLEGWVVDPIAQAPCSEVVAAIDDVPIQRAIYGIERLDVMAFLANPAYCGIGFNVGLLPPHWTPGFHHVTLRAVNVKRSGYYELDVVVCVRVRAD